MTAVRRLTRWAALLAVVGVVAAGCSSASGGSANRPRRSSRSPITREEMGDKAALDLYQLVQQLRPNWLTGRGQDTPVGGLRTVKVVIDGTLQSGGLEVLRTLRGSQVEEMRFLNGQDATTRYGLDVEAGVIVVTTLRARGGGQPPSP